MSFLLNQITLILFLTKSKQSKRISVVGHLQYFSHWDIPFGMNPVLEQSFIEIEAKKAFPMHFRDVLTQIRNSRPGSKGSSNNT